MKTKAMFETKVLVIHKLRINVKSLAEESRMIRTEVARCGIAYKNTLQLHRTGRLRRESRTTQLALAFVRGRAYREVELKAKELPDANAIAKKLARAYDQPVEEVMRWSSEVNKWLLSREG